MDRELSFVSAVYLVGNPLYCTYIEVFLRGSNVFGYGPFYRYGGDIEFIRFKEYFGMLIGHSLSIFVRFSGKKRTPLYISREKGKHY